MAEEKDIKQSKVSPFMLELDNESKIITKLLVFEEICCWLQTFRPSNPGGST